ncbi:MAG: SBBP repeat-containing protein [Candidatus Hermodarchaeota archaeon]
MKKRLNKASNKNWLSSRASNPYRRKDTRIWMIPPIFIIGLLILFIVLQSAIGGEQYSQLGQMTEINEKVLTSEIHSQFRDVQVSPDEHPNHFKKKENLLSFTGFIQNLGQISDGSIKYYYSSSKTAIGFESSIIKVISSDAEETEYISFSITFPGSNNVEPVGKAKKCHAINYFYADVQITNVPTYEEIWYPELYPGIDLRYYMSDQGLKYDFVAYPEADPNQIAIQVSQSMELTIEDQKVSLRSSTPQERVYFPNPQLQAWQADGTPIFTQFVSKTMNPNTCGFQVGVRDFSQSLITDPLILSFSTYLGGSNDEVGRAIEVSDAGDVYITGSTTSSNFPTLNGYNNTYSGSKDAFITKMDATGTLVFSTFLGGTGGDRGRGIAVDANGNSYIVGITDSNDFPTKNAYNNTYNGGWSDVFLTKLNATGNGLVFSTYFGGSSFDEGLAIAVDSINNTYITGWTGSSDFPTQNAYNNTFGGWADAFVAKFNTTGWLNFSTYLGGDDSDFGHAIAVDLAGNSYITGNTTSEDFPTKNGWNDLVVGDAFVTKLNATGNGLVFSTLLGGSGYDDGFDIAVDTAENCYVTGSAGSNFPTRNAYNSTYSGNGDIFVAKFNSTGLFWTGEDWTGLIFSTYLGGTSYDWAFSIAVDAYNNSYVTGWTASSDFPTYIANDSTHNGGWDAFVTKLNATGNGLVFSTYLGGSNTDVGYGIAVDADSVYITGFTSSNNFPTQNAYDSTHNGGTDSFVTKLHSGEPMINLISPSNNSTQKSGTIIDLNIVDDDGISLVLYNWDWDANVTLEAPYDVTLPIDEGYHELNVYANDSLDNWSYRPFLFLTDDTCPTIMLKSPTNASIHPSGTLISFDITDVYGISQVRYNWDGTSNNSISAPYEISLIEGDGQHVLHVYAYDNAGNWVYKTFSFITDDNPTDSDDDGLTDLYEEQISHTNPNDPDSDNDGLNDGLEINTYHTNATNPDTDEDGMPDGWEVSNQFNPLNSTDGWEDADGDGLINSQEYTHGTLPHNNDTDNDGLTDGAEVNTYNTDPLDHDTDNDGLTDGYEVAWGLDPLTPLTTTISSTTTLQSTPFAGLIIILFTLGLLGVLIHTRRKK